MKPKYLSVKEVASIVCISEKTVYKLIVKGEIAGHFKLGSIHLIDEDVFLMDLKTRATTKAKKVTERGDNRHKLR